MVETIASTHNIEHDMPHTKCRQLGAYSFLRLVTFRLVAWSGVVR